MALGLTAEYVRRFVSIEVRCQNRRHRKNHGAECYVRVPHGPDGPGYERLADGTYKAWRKPATFNNGR